MPLPEATRFGWLAFVAVSLSACVAWSPSIDLPSRTLPVEWSARSAALASWADYSLRARVSATRGQEVVTARLAWWQRADRSRLSLTSPLGIGGLDLTVDDEFEQGLNEALGFEVPVKSLRYWLLGIPDPRFAVKDVEMMSTGGVDLPQSFSQAGWQVRLQRYASVPTTELMMPSRLDLQSDSVEVRVFVEAWGAVK